MTPTEYHQYAKTGGGEAIGALSMLGGLYVVN